MTDDELIDKLVDSNAELQRVNSAVSRENDALRDRVEELEHQCRTNWHAKRLREAKDRARERKTTAKHLRWRASAAELERDEAQKRLERYQRMEVVWGVLGLVIGGMLGVGLS